MQHPNEAGEAVGRSHIYLFFAGVFSQAPTPEGIAAIRNKSILQEMEGHPENPGYRELEHFVEEAGTISDLADVLTAEFTQLFVLPMGIRPYESVYLDKDQRLGGKVTIAVKNFYENAGMEFLPTCLDTADHIGMELEFMGRLTALEAEGWTQGSASSLSRILDLERDFLSSHLGRWASALSDRIREEGTVAFYRAMALLMKGFVEEDLRYLENLKVSAALK